MIFPDDWFCLCRILTRNLESLLTLLFICHVPICKTESIHTRDRQLHKDMNEGHNLQFKDFRRIIGIQSLASFVTFVSNFFEGLQNSQPQDGNVLCSRHFFLLLQNSVLLATSQGMFCTIFFFLRLFETPNSFFPTLINFFDHAFFSKI